MSVGFSFSCYFCLLVFMALFHSCSANKNVDDVLCMDIERQALLQFKDGLIDEADRLASWVGENKDCCRWDGVVCDNVTGQVQRIHLPGVDGHCNGEFSATKEYEEALKQRLRGIISRSLLYLKQLKHLDLSCNNFEGVQIPSFMGSLGTLRYLNLSRSNFGGIVPPQLGNLSELHVLCLGSFYDGTFELSSMMNMQWLSNLRMLHHLDLSYVDLSKVVDWLQVINTLPSLVELHLSGCQLSHIQPHVASLNITSLSLLDLSHNDFSNTFVPWWIFSITSLVSLDLSLCSFQRPIPSKSDSFHNLTSLELLHVSGNVFMNSSLVFKELSNVSKNLISLDISSCGVSSSVLNALHNLTSLLSLDLSENQLTKPIDKSLCNFCKLRHVDLAYNTFRNISLTYLLESFLGCTSPRLESLSSLEVLHLENNLISGSIPNSIGQLSCLEVLSLENNLISGSLPNSIGQLSSLEVLRLENNLISGSIPNSIGQLSCLDVLHLENNLISGSIPNSIRQLSRLEVLRLENNLISGSIPNSIGQLSCLEVLRLDINLISGPIPNSIERLSSLKELFLDHNLISGQIPNSIGKLSSLEVLHLSYNRLNGSLPISLGQLSKLVTLDFSYNLLTSVVTEAHFAKLTSLMYLKGSGNHLTLRPCVANWTPSFHLDSLYLNSWDLGPQFPLWLQSQMDLRVLDISNTKISSTMPESFWTSFPDLQYLNMSQNRIQGRLLSIPKSVDVVDLSSNKFSGQLPLPDRSTTYIMDLSNNSFAGSLHHLLCPYGGEGLLFLNLATNRLSGVIPDCWGQWQSLQFLNLENNNLSGGIPRSMGSLSNLGSLNLCNNKLSGILPASLKNLTNLEVLQVARNELVGSIPTWFGSELLGLRVLNLRSNNFVGNIPREICYLTAIQILDLANNKFLGNIPRCFNNFSVLSTKETNSSHQISFSFEGLDNVDILDSASLVIKGREDTYSSILGLVTTLDLSSNNFFGQIPSELTTLHGLRSLNLSRNQLTGWIPEKIRDMKSLESFDVSLNKLSGKLPVTLSNLNFLSSFNVSYNSLTGQIPSSTQLQSFNESSFFGNKLCGDPLKKQCDGVVVPDRDQKEGGGSHDGTDWGLIISIVLGFFAGFWVIIIPLIVNRRWRIAYFRFLNDLRYMFFDVLRKYCGNIFPK